ncbi:hypothetical protein D9M69_720750 [compost metagenome]
MGAGSAAGSDRYSARPATASGSGPQARRVSTAEQFTQGERLFVAGQEIQEIRLLKIVNAEAVKVPVPPVGEDMGA